MMPGPPAGPISPYHIFVTAVHNSGGSAVSGAQFTLKNTTKSTQTIATSSESDSNIVLNVADCGAWDNGDGIELEVSFGTENKTETTTVDTVTHPAGGEFGLIVLEITSVDVAMVLSMSQDIGNAAARHVGAELTLAQFIGVEDGSPTDAALSLPVVQSVTFTATSIVVGVITPPGRTVYITAETRTPHGGYNT